MDEIFKVDTNDSFEILLKELLSQNRTTIQDIKTAVPINIIEAAKEELRKLFIEAKFDINEVSEHIINRHYDQERSKRFVSLLKETKMEIFQSIVTHYNTTYGETVTDYRWLLKLVLGTSESKVLNYPLMQLVLQTVHSNQQKLKLYEIHKDVLISFIKSLETYCLDDINRL